MSNPVVQLDPLEALQTRLQNLSQKLNCYIQSNGCSKALKQKAESYFGPATTKEKEIPDACDSAEKLEA